MTPVANEVETFLLVKISLLMHNALKDLDDRQFKLASYIQLAIIRVLSLQVRNLNNVQRNIHTH